MEFNHVKCETPDLAKQNLEKLKALFPGVVTEGPDGVAIDVEALKQECSATPIEGNVERYEFTWPGKRAAKAAASTTTNKTLRPCRAESVNFDTTENLYIEGDNLEVLKLLQTNYAGKVKMIYIDPPYNTGHDFVYRDRFSLTQKELESDAGAFDDDGNRFEVNDSSEARYHSNWCSMMYPRLKLARQLLRDDGVLFMSIDDNEIDNLRRMSDELFWEKNRIAQITVIVKTEGRQYGHFAKTHEYLLVYAKDAEKVSLNEVLDPEARFRYHDIKGGFNTIGLRNRAVRIFNSTNRPNLRYPFYVDVTKVDEDGFMPVYTEKEGKEFIEVWPSVVDGLESVWRWGKETASAKRDELVATKGSDGEIRIFKKDRELTTLPKTMWLKKEFNSIYGTREVAELIGSGKFDFPKPLSLINQIVEIGSDQDSLVVDFFSGSSTTAHAVMKQNAIDGGARRYVMVQLPERSPDGSTICNLAQERIRRAGKKILEEWEGRASARPQGDLFSNGNTDAQERVPPDIGFRVLKLDSSSLEDASETASGTQQQMLGLSRIKGDRTSEDLLFQILLESKLSLSESIVREKVEGNEVFFVGVEKNRMTELQNCGEGEIRSFCNSVQFTDAPLVACLDAQAKMTEAFFTALAKVQPALAFFRDDLFESDSARINLAQIFKQFSPSTTITVI